MRYLPNILIVTAFGMAGCASWFMNGGKLVETGYAPSVVKSYQVPTCTLSNGSSIAGPADTTFQLVKDGPQVGIFERAADGSGAVITNGWTDATADHYFGWVQSSGWEYVIPKDPAGQAQRLVYVSLATKAEGTVTKPASAISATCPMVAAR